MKKTIIILNEYLSHFWFSTLLLTIGGLLVIQFSSLAYSVDYWNTDKLSYISNIFGAFLIYFFLPLGVLSVVISLLVLFGDKTEKNRRGLTSLLLVILTICFIFFFIIRITSIARDINVRHNLIQPEIILNNMQG